MIVKVLIFSTHSSPAFPLPCTSLILLTPITFPQIVAKVTKPEVQKKYEIQYVPLGSCIKFLIQCPLEEVPAVCREGGYTLSDTEFLRHERFKGRVRCLVVANVENHTLRSIREIEVLITCTRTSKLVRLKN